jgi:hypothetical protein
MAFRGNTKPARKSYRYNGWCKWGHERTVCIFDMELRGLLPVQSVIFAQIVRIQDQPM